MTATKAAVTVERNLARMGVDQILAVRPAR
jgi:hypothetical protein